MAERSEKTELRLSIIGCGNMGAALVRGFVLSAKNPKQILVCDCEQEKVDKLVSELGVSGTLDSSKAITDADAVIFALKPQVLGASLEALRPVVKNLSSKPFIVSVAAGTRLALFREKFGFATRVARVMPNLPCAVGSGMCAVYAEGGEERERAKELFSRLGKVLAVESEEVMDTLTALSGSGPAFVFTFIESLADGAVKMGLDRERALFIAAQTVLGAGRLVLESKEHPARLRDMVVSPGGTTAAGLHALEKSAFRGAVIGAVEAAAKRAGEVSKK